MPEAQITNPKGAFGYSPFDGTDQQRGVREVGTFRNMSSANPILVGSAVCLSSNSTDGTGVAVSTAIASPLFLGVALTSGSTDQSTALTSQALSGAWVKVCLKGPCVALLSTATAPGMILVNGGASTVLGSTGSTVGGQLAPLSTLIPAPAAGTIEGIAGVALTSATTGSTGFLTTATTSPRGLVYLRPGYAIHTTA